jgi:hypothetical protein
MFTERTLQKTVKEILHIEEEERQSQTQKPGEKIQKR